MKYKLLLSSLSVSLLSANLALSPSIELYPEEGLFLPHEAFATLKAGYLCDYLWELSLTSKEHVNKAHLNRFSNLGMVGLCLSDLVEIDSFMGVEKNHLSFHKNRIHETYKENAHFSWGVTASGILNTWGKFQLGTTGFYQQVPEHSGTLSIGGSTMPDKFRRYTWGVSLGFSYDYPVFAPYARLDFQKSKIHLESLPDQSFHEKHPLGIALGFVTDPLKGIYADFEVRMIQEYGVRLFLGARI